MADKFAKEAASATSMRSEPFFPIGAHTIKKKLSEVKKKIKDRYWYSSDSIRHLKQLKDGYNTAIFIKKNLRILTASYRTLQTAQTYAQDRNEL